MKPEYCTNKNVGCDVCEYYKDELCNLNETYRKILDDILEEEKNAK